MITKHFTITLYVTVFYRCVLHYSRTKRVLSGMQPTGSGLHLGNYLGAMRQWLSLQHNYETYYCVVDLHAITTPQDPKKLREATISSAAVYIAAGIDVTDKKDDIC